jgi:hypothetical protein
MWSISLFGPKLPIWLTLVLLIIARKIYFSKQQKKETTTPTTTKQSPTPSPFSRCKPTISPQHIPIVKLIPMWILQGNWKTEAAHLADVASHHYCAKNLFLEATKKGNDMEAYYVALI